VWITLHASLEGHLLVGDFRLDGLPLLLDHLVQPLVLRYLLVH
jgi:hypothetical protein